MERKARKLHWKKKKQFDMSLERLKKKISSFAVGQWRKNLTRPVRRKQINIFFDLIECSQLIVCSKAEVTTGLIVITELRLSKSLVCFWHINWNDRRKIIRKGPKSRLGLQFGPLFSQLWAPRLRFLYWGPVQPFMGPRFGGPQSSYKQSRVHAHILRKRIREATLTRYVSM